MDDCLPNSAKPIKFAGGMKMEQKLLGLGQYINTKPNKADTTNERQSQKK
jgi:hypothetical protein